MPNDTAPNDATPCEPCVDDDPIDAIDLDSDEELSRAARVVAWILLSFAVSIGGSFAIGWAHGGWALPLVWISAFAAASGFYPLTSYAKRGIAAHVGLRALHVYVGQLVLTADDRLVREVLEDVQRRIVEARNRAARADYRDAKRLLRQVQDDNAEYVPQEKAFDRGEAQGFSSAALLLGMWLSDVRTNGDGAKWDEEIRALVDRFCRNAEALSGGSGSHLGVRRGSDDPSRAGRADGLALAVDLVIDRATLAQLQGDRFGAEVLEEVAATLRERYAHVVSMTAVDPPSGEYAISDAESDPAES